MVIFDKILSFFMLNNSIELHLQKFGAFVEAVGSDGWQHLQVSNCSNVICRRDGAARMHFMEFRNRKVQKSNNHFQNSSPLLRALFFPFSFFSLQKCSLRVSGLESRVCTFSKRFSYAKGIGLQIKILINCVSWFSLDLTEYLDCKSLP